MPKLINKHQLNDEIQRQSKLLYLQFYGEKH